MANWDVTKTLKAHALYHMGRHGEAMEECRDVKLREPTDDAVLSHLSSAFKMLGAPEEATQCYENGACVRACSCAYVCICVSVCPSARVVSESA